MWDEGGFGHHAALLPAARPARQGIDSIHPSPCPSPDGRGDAGVTVIGSTVPSPLGRGTG